MDDDYRDYRKNKRQQKLYKPGSGPLRRSRYGLDSTMDSYSFDNAQSYRDRSHYGSHQSINGEDTMKDVREQVASRHRKPEQLLYTPKSGESYSEVDRPSKSTIRCNTSSQYNNRNTQDNYSSIGSTGSHKSVSGRDFSQRDEVANDFNSNRHYRQGSETRSISPGHYNRDYNSLDRNRDSRSMETWAGRNKQGGGKPPSGRRNSAGYSSVNLDNIPPRFRKKYLEKAGHQSFDSVDQLHRDQHTANEFIQSGYNTGQFYNSNTNWSQTLPSRGRGRIRDHEHFDREKFMNSYLKNYEVHNSRRSTPSNSHINLYESSLKENRDVKEKPTAPANEGNQHNVHDNVTVNGTSNANSDLYANEKDSRINNDSDKINDCETASHNSTNLSDLTNLDWTEEVEKNIKLDDLCNTTTSFSQNINPLSNEEVKIETRDSKKSSKSRRKDRRSSSRGHKNTERKERNRKDSNVSLHEAERTRKDSNVSVQYDCMPSNLKYRERERQDSHRSNRSSTIGNSRDDLDRWRSLRSFSREHSTER